MNNETDFSRCSHLDTPGCPAQNLDLRAGKTFVIYSDNGKTTSFSDILDFIKYHGCGKCKKYKEINLNLPIHDV